METEEPASHN